jgi:phage tail sheath protein FI
MASSFPSSRKISPSVRIAERDFSATPLAPSTNKTALVGFAQKGPIGVPRTINNLEEFFRIYGSLNPKFEGYLGYAAKDYFREGSELIVTRAGEDDESNEYFARRAYVDIPSGGIHARIVSGATEATWGGTGNSLTSERYIRLRVNGSRFTRELVIPKDVEFQSLTNEGAYSERSLETLLKNQIKKEDGFTITNCGTGTAARLVFRSLINGPESSIEIISSRNNIYNSTLSNTVDADTDVDDITLGIGLLMGQAIKTGDADAYNSSVVGTWNFAGYRNLKLEVVVWGSGDPLIDGQIQPVYLPADSEGDNLNGVTTNALLDWLNGIAANSPNTNNKGFVFVKNVDGNIQIIAGSVGAVIPTGPTQTDVEVWYYTGADARILVRPSSSAASFLGFDNVAAKGTDPDLFEDEDNVCIPVASKLNAAKVVGSSSSNPNSTMRIWASTPGSWANGQARVLLTVDKETAKFNIRVEYRNFTENMNNLHKDENAEGYESIFYVERYVNGLSDFITVEDDSSIPDLPAAGVYILGSTDESAPNSGTDGIPADPFEQARLLIGSEEKSSGIYSLAEPERIDIDLVAVPGVSTTSVILAMKRLCEEIRMDCMFIVDPPMSMTAREVKKWHNGQHPLNTTKIDSSYGALYWPWLKQEDPYNNVDVWTPPSGSALAVYARTDGVAFPWKAPAGLNRGQLPWVKETEYVAYLNERDELYADDNCVNVIINLPNENPTIFGQKTMQRFPSKLDRVNVRRMFLYCEKNCRRQARYIMFENHNELLREEMIQIADQVVGPVVNNGGANDYKVICDEILNTNEVTDRNELRVRIGIQPTPAAEFIFIEFTSHRTGSFEVSNLGPAASRVR